MVLCGVISQRIVIGLLQILEPVPDILFLMYVDSRHHMFRKIDCTSTHIVSSLYIGHFVYILRCWRKNECFDISFSEVFEVHCSGS